MLVLLDKASLMTWGSCLSPQACRRQKQRRRDLHVTQHQFDPTMSRLFAIWSPARSRLPQLSL